MFLKQSLLFTSLMMISTLSFSDTSLFSSSQQENGCIHHNELIIDNDNDLNWRQSLECGDQIYTNGQTTFSGVSVKTWFYILTKAKDLQDEEEILFSWENDIVASITKDDNNNPILEISKESNSYKQLPLRINVNSLDDDNIDVSVLLKSMMNEYYKNTVKDS